MGSTFDNQRYEAPTSVGGFILTLYRGLVTSAKRIVQIHVWARVYCIYIHNTHYMIHTRSIVQLSLCLPLSLEGPRAAVQLPASRLLTGGAGLRTVFPTTRPFPQPCCTGGGTQTPSHACWEPTLTQLLFCSRHVAPPGQLFRLALHVGTHCLTGATCPPPWHVLKGRHTRLGPQSRSALHFWTAAELHGRNPPQARMPSPALGSSGCAGSKLMCSS